MHPRLIGDIDTFPLFPIDKLLLFQFFSTLIDAGVQKDENLGAIFSFTSCFKNKIDKVASWVTVTPRAKFTIKP